MSIVDKVCFFPTAKGGIAAAGLLRHQVEENCAKAFIFGVTIR